MGHNSNILIKQAFCRSLWLEFVELNLHSTGLYERSYFSVNQNVRRIQCNFEVSHLLSSVMGISYPSPDPLPKSVSHLLPWMLLGPYVLEGALKVYDSIKKSIS